MVGRNSLKEKKRKSLDLRGSHPFILIHTRALMTNLSGGLFTLQEKLKGMVFFKIKVMLVF